MKKIYRGFKTECPTGLITEEAFQGIYSKFFPHGGMEFILHIKKILAFDLWTRRNVNYIINLLSKLRPYGVTMKGARRSRVL